MTSAAVMAGAIIGLLCLPAAAPGHEDSLLLPEGCGSCHVGHGLSGQPMLALSEEEFCYQCHGSSEKRTRMVDTGRLSAAAVLSDIEAEFQKTYRHPVEEGFGHSPQEELPRLSAGKVRHAECVDCHNPHQKIRGGEAALLEVKGYSVAGRHLQTSAYEYEVCLKCHSDRLGLSTGERSLTNDFSLDARSQHPVTRPGSGTRPPSLLSPIGKNGTMKCSDCHRSDDPDAPAGPHGSSHQYLLSGNYDLGVYVDESPFAFEFCYSCHDRSSILDNESFPLHRQHLLGDPLEGRSGTSCYTCHVSRGSLSELHLLEFNPQAVQPEDLSRVIEYRQLGSGSGQCLLKCHDYNHGPGKY
jgi:predicted CXXCH cytochrome family protein